MSGGALRTALYYPHTALHELGDPHGSPGSAEHMVKSALLLWDRLEFIVPYKGYRANYRHRGVAEAMELIGASRVPHLEEKQQAHRRIENFVSKPLPQTFYFLEKHQRSLLREQYEIWPEKFLDKTWQLLRERHLAGSALRTLDVPSTKLAGLSIMAILAECCAGTTRARITDRSEAYAIIGSMLAKPQRRANGMEPDPYQRLASIPLPIVNPDTLTLDDLLAFRKREASDSSRSLQALRHRYLDHISGYVDRVRSARTSADFDEVRRTFQDDVAKDLGALMGELNRSKTQFKTSKWVFATVLGVPLSVAAHALGIPITIEGALSAAGAPLTLWDFMSSLTDLYKRKVDILEKHPTAYLYQLIQNARP
jgi:hypothetical protein